MAAATASYEAQFAQQSRIALWWDRVITPKRLHRDVSLRMSRLVSILTLAMMTIAVGAGNLTTMVLFPERFLRHNTFWAGAVAIGILASSYLLNRRGHYYSASTLLVFAVIFCPFLATSDYHYYEPLWVLHGMTSSSVLLASIVFPERRIAIFTAVIVLVLTLALPLLNSPVDMSASLYPLVLVLFSSYEAFLFSHHRSQLEKERQASLLEALQAAERLAAIVEGTSDFVASAYLDGRTFYLNTAGREIVGLELNIDISDLTITEMSPGWVGDTLYREAIPTAFRDGTWTGETALLRASGEEIPTSQTIIAHRNPDGSPAYFSTIARDISQQKQAAQERERLIRDLLAAKRLAEENSRLKSEFLSMMSHELRTPLNAIEGFTGVVLKKMGGADYNGRTEEYLNRVHSNSRRLLQLINDFLDLSRVEAGRLELAHQPFVPERLAQRWRDEIGVLAERKGVAFELQLDPTLPETLYGDDEAISKVAINLLSNAIKFTEKGSVTLALGRSEDTWSITVTDTGIGIPPHAKEFIFEEFRQVDQTSKRKYGGTGLGLAIVQKYVRSMGGSVSVRSELGLGSSFAVVLPLKTTA